MPRKTNGISKRSRKVILLLCALVILASGAGVLVWFLRKKNTGHTIGGNLPFSNPTELRLAILNYYGDENSKNGVVEKYGLIKNWDVSQMTSLELAFAGDDVSNPLDETSTLELNREDLSKWNVSSVENMVMMCFGNKNFNNATIGLWNVGSVTSMNQSFAKSGFVSDISSWNVSNVENMYGIFKESNFKVDISGWDVSKVKDWDNAFLNCPLGVPSNINLLPPKFR